jgi:hypothetical protein
VGVEGQICRGLRVQTRRGAPIRCDEPPRGSETARLDDNLPDGDGIADYCSQSTGFDLTDDFSEAASGIL